MALKEIRLTFGDEMALPQTINGIGENRDAVDNPSKDSGHYTQPLETFPATTSYLNCYDQEPCCVVHHHYGRNCNIHRGQYQLQPAPNLRCHVIVADIAPEIKGHVSVVHHVEG